MTSIFPSGTPVPVPAAVDWFKACGLPQHVKDAVRAQAAAVYAEGREVQLARIARANKVLATVPARGSLVVRGAV
ncbi:hypothetical protein [Streptomyces sp. Ac-502]|uniref:hypothetical protein n=1 Tax=Streptomyces sp. Ac-502 TaxID=3342801 RepID=UPI0038624BD6